MAEFREARIEKLSPLEGDGVNRQFSTPTPFQTGSIRVFVNGKVYESDHPIFGWVEITSSLIELVVAPKSGDYMEAFYRDETGIFGGDEVIGSPFAPGESC